MSERDFSDLDDGISGDFDGLIDEPGNVESRTACP